MSHSKSVHFITIMLTLHGLYGDRHTMRNHSESALKYNYNNTKQYYAEAIITSAVSLYEPLKFTTDADGRYLKGPWYTDGSFRYITEFLYHENEAKPIPYKPHSYHR